MTNVILKSAVAGCLVVLVGCAKEDAWQLQKPEREFTELEDRLETVMTGKLSFVENLEPEEVIVAVNGYPLTRRFFDEDMVIAAKGLMSRPGNTAETAGQILQNRKPEFVKQFVMKRLLLDAAKKQNKYDAAFQRDAIEKYMKALAKASKTTPEKVMKRLGADAKHVFYDIAERATVDKFVREAIPPLVKVDEEFVSNVQHQVTMDNQVAARTNALYRALMLQWKDEIRSGKRNIKDIVDAYNKGKDAVHRAIGEEWGEFEQNSLDDRRIARAVFKLRLGEVSDPLEDDNGYHLVQVTKITPPVKNEKGRVIQHEVRRLSHLYLEKEPEIIRQNDNEMFTDLRQQMQMQAIYAYADNLLTNGQNEVIYPHGERLFPE